MSKSCNCGWKRKCLNTAIILFLAMILFFQGISLFAIALAPTVSPAKAITEATWLVPTWIVAIVAIYGAVALCKVWRKREKLLLIPLALSVAGAVPATAVSLTIRAAYNDVVGLDGNIALTDWEWFWRHATPMIIALVVVVVAIVRIKALRDERIRKENESYVDRFTPDADPTAAPAPRKKLSKKQRKAQKSGH